MNEENYDTLPEKKTKKVTSELGKKKQKHRQTESQIHH